MAYRYPTDKQSSPRSLRYVGRLSDPYRYRTGGPGASGEYAYHHPAHGEEPEHGRPVAQLLRALPHGRAARAAGGRAAAAGVRGARQAAAAAAAAGQHRAVGRAAGLAPLRGDGKDAAAELGRVRRPRARQEQFAAFPTRVLAVGGTSRGCIWHVMGSGCVRHVVAFGMSWVRGCVRHVVAFGMSWVGGAGSVTYNTGSPD